MYKPETLIISKAEIGYEANPPRSNKTINITPESNIRVGAIYLVKMIRKPAPKLKITKYSQLSYFSIELPSYFDRFFIFALLNSDYPF
jgi:hypothetical protein